VRWAAGQDAAAFETGVVFAARGAVIYSSVAVVVEAIAGFFVGVDSTTAGCPATVLTTLGSPAADTDIGATRTHLAVDALAALIDLTIAVIIGAIATLRRRIHTTCAGPPAPLLAILDPFATGPNVSAARAGLAMHTGAGLVDFAVAVVIEAVATLRLGRIEGLAGELALFTFHLPLLAGSRQ